MLYKNISDSSFKFFKQKLKALEDEIEGYCLMNGFYINRERFYVSTLVINLNSSDINNGFEGNISLQFIDEKGSVQFKFGLIKTYDIGNYRHFSKKTILEECTLDYFKENAITLLEKAFTEYNSIKLEDMTSRLELPPRYE